MVRCPLRWDGEGLGRGQRVERGTTLLDVGLEGWERAGVVPSFGLYRRVLGLGVGLCLCGESLVSLRRCLACRNLWVIAWRSCSILCEPALR